MYRFIAQEGTSPSRTDLQAAYQGSAAGWNLVPLTFFSSSGSLAGGYVLTFHILFSSLGLSGPPQEGTNWGIALTLHDRDDSAGNILTDTSWPLNKEPLRSETWGQLSFGFPSYSPPEVTAPQTITIRNGLNGARVVDGVVGGNTLCGEGLDFWYEWGTHSYSGAREMNVQNEGRIDDWPCFSKFYITFPLESLPPGKTIVSATLTLHQSGQSTGFSSDPPEALNSLIQISEVGQDWDEATLSWNNGPLPQENVSQNWVGPITMEDWGKPWSWDVSRVVSSAYSARRPLRLAFYSADHYGPNGKYLLSSDAETSVRPVLTVIVGDLK